jgi:RNA polymerase sigma-70 factor (ECF subfamily)
MEDRDIVALFVQKDEKGIKAAASKYGGALRQLARSLIGDRHIAEECENDTYLEAWNTIPPHEPGNYLFAFLARITRHLSLNCCRDRSRLKRSAFICELSEEMEHCIPAPDDTECRIDEIVLNEAINDFLGNLSEEKRNVFLRRYWYLDSIADISKRFALSESKVTSMLFRCRKQLREHLIKEGYTL